ncbi:MAG: helix-turn-helix transcriptional regulator [Oricola sp.]
MSTPLSMRDIAKNWQVTRPGREALTGQIETLCHEYGGDGAILFRIRPAEAGPEIRPMGSFGIDPVLADAVVERAAKAIARKGLPETLPLMIPAWRIGGSAAYIYALPGCPRPQGQFVVACLSLEQKQFAAIAELYLAARCIMDGLDTLPGAIDESHPRISTREHSCLAWTAEGKTSEEIGIILDLSPHTVNHYLGSAARKLGASNRMHAVAKAMRLGLIERPV